MTELTIDQALQQAIAAHKAEQVQKADRLYTAILKAQPKHPDANHNMGVLAVGVGKVEQALPFFKTAVEANPATVQFWLSYTDTLIKLGKLADAKAVLDQAKSKGAKGDGFDKLEKRLQAAGRGLVVANQIVSEPKPKQPNILDSLKLDQAIKLAKKKVRESSHDGAKRIYQDILVKFPKNKRARDGIKSLLSRPVGEASKVQDPPQDQLQSVINLYCQGQLQQALEQAETLVNQFPKASILHNIQGAVFKGLGQLERSIEAYKKALAIEPNYAEVLNNMGDALKEQGKLEEAIVACDKALAIKPDYAEAYNNMGNALQGQGKLEEAIETYTKALAINPDYAEVYNNMGIALKDQGKLEQAIQAYNKAVEIKPDYVEAHNNMGNTLNDQGKLEEAIGAYNKALAIKPDYAEAVENSLSLAVQLLPIVADYGYDFATSEAQANSEVGLRPKYQIQNAIKAYLEADFSFTHLHNNNFKACGQKFFRNMNAKDKVFCNAYSNFIGKLLDATWHENPDTNNKVYHLGESHCLSYAHQNIMIDSSIFRITPRITFGAKAFHFSRTKHNKFTAITKAHFVSLPKNSKVLLSFGEIDCRANEGFISAATKLDRPLEELIEQTAKGYVQWFLNQNAGPKHRLYFINVPAPLYDKKHSVDLNSEVARTVALFNAALKDYSLHHDFDIVDVFKFTAGREGFSNGLFHIDNRHLGAQAIDEIEKQLT